MPNNLSLDEVIEKTLQDQEIQLARQSVLCGHWDKRSQFYNVRQSLAVTENQLLMRGTQLVIPQQLRTKTLYLAHSGHQGIVKTKQALRSKVWWPRLDREAEAFVKQCQVCQSLGHRDPLPPLRQNTLPNKSWERLHMVKEEEVDYKELHKQARANVEKKQSKAQEYTDAKRKARNKELIVGTKVLVKQQHKSKFTPAFDPKPLIVEHVKGTMITAGRADYMQGYKKRDLFQTVNDKARNRRSGYNNRGR